MTVKTNHSLSRAFAFSIGCNIFFLLVILYFALFDPPWMLRFSQLPPKKGQLKASPSLEEEIARLQLLSFDTLKKKLRSDEEIELGYKEKDLALALLVARHYFDIKRATEGTPLKKMIVKYNQCEEIEFFTSLSPFLWEKIVQFAEEERFPFTGEGLSRKLTSEEVSPPLLLALLQTEEFSLVQTLFSRSGKTIPKGTLVCLFYEIPWKNISQFVDDQKKGCDFSAPVRQQFLLNCLRKKSPAAAHLILLTDKEFALKKTSDTDLLLLLLLLKTKMTPEAVAFVKEVLHSPRQEQFLQKAALLMHSFEPVAAIPPELKNVKNLRPVFRDRPPAAPAPHYHIIQPGETLYTIAARYHIPVDVLIHQNGLSSSLIRPGQTLRLP